MKVQQDVWNAALIYTRVVFLGTLGNLGYNMNAGILRGLGDSKVYNDIKKQSKYEGNENLSVLALILFTGGLLWMTR